MYKKNARDRIFKRKMDNMFYECRYLFATLVIIILFFTFCGMSDNDFDIDYDQYLEDNCPMNTRDL